MTRESFKKLAKITVALYVASFLIINWNEVSWVFNYRAVSGMVSDFFTPYPSVASGFEGNFFPNQATDAVKYVSNVKTNYTSQVNAIEIPKLSLLAPVVFSTNPDNAAVEKDLDSGVVYYPGSVMPGQIGNAVILGHSAPPLWPKIKYDWVFSQLDKLQPGDVILVDLNNKQYTYVVRKTTIIKKGEEIPADPIDKVTNVLNLVSCWPPGKDIQRIVVQAELKRD